VEDGVPTSRIRKPISLPKASDHTARLATMPTMAAYAAIMQRNRKREGSEGLSCCLVGRRERPEVSEIEAGDHMQRLETYRRIYKLYGWPQTFAR
jgi:hypothetical protein